MEEIQTTATKRPSKKQTQREVFQKLSGALADYKVNLNGKRFESNLKKASKLFATDIVKSIKKDRKKRNKELNGKAQDLQQAEVKI